MNLKTENKEVVKDQPQENQESQGNQESQEEQLLTISIDDVLIDEKLNCRGVIPLSDLAELAEDIKKNGLLQPVLCRYRHDDESFEQPYVLVAGFSRSKAVRDLVKGKELKAVVRPLTKQQCIVLNAAENLKRRDLNIMQEAESLRRMVRMGMDRDQIVEAVGKSTGWVQPRLYLLQLPEPIQRIAAAGFLTTDNIRNLYSLTDEKDQLLVAKQIKSAKQADRYKKVEVKAFQATSETKRNRARVGRHRTKSEIENLMEWLVEINYPFGFHMSVLAWAAGNIDDLELQARIQTDFNELGRSFTVKKEGIPNIKERDRIL